MKLLNIIIVFFSIFCNAQNKELISKTYLKLQNDSKSFEQFVFYGFCNCNDTYLYTETFEDNYTTTFNHLEPLPRFFEKEEIKKVLETYHNKYKKRFEGVQNSYYNGYLIVSKCYKLYNVSNKNLKKAYYNLLSNDRLQKEWIEDYIRDYLDYYFIKVQTE